MQRRERELNSSDDEKETMFLAKCSEYRGRFSPSTKDFLFCGSMEKGKKQHINPFLILGVFLLLLFLLRFGLIFRFNLLLFLFLAGTGILGFGFWRRWQASRQQQLYKESPEGRIKDRIEYCNTHIQKINTELQQIQKDIQDLEKNLQRAQDPADQYETEQLIEAFRGELELRKAKKAFFQNCLLKLEDLLNKYQVSKSIASKKNKLQELREEDYDDLLKMENLRADVETDILLLDDIEVLSLKTLESNSLDNIQELKKELDEMTRGLDGYV